MRRLRGVDSGEASVADGDLAAAVLFDQKPVLREEIGSWITRESAPHEAGKP